MVRVAVAGGSDGLGKAIVDAIRREGKHEVVILSRRANENSPVIVVDYSSVESLRSVLDRERIHTVISTIGLYTECHHHSQLNLIEASELTPCTERFIPSEFGIPTKPEQASHNRWIAHRSPSFPFKIDTLRRLEKSTLEFALIHTGIFLDYLVWPRIPSHLQCQTVWLHLGLNAAAIPGDGSVPVAFAHSEDVGRFVSLMLDLPSWDKRYYAIADRLTLNELIRIVKEVKGVDVEVKYDPREILDRGECTLLPGPIEDEFKDNRFNAEAQYVKYMAALGSLVDDGLFDIDSIPIEEAFPNFEPLTVMAAVERWVALG